MQHNNCAVGIKLMLMNPTTFYVNENLETVTELLQIAIDRELTSDQSQDFQKWYVEYGIPDRELTVEEIFIEDIEDLYEKYVYPIADKFYIDVDLDKFKMLHDINLTDNQKMILGKKYLNRKLDNQERTVLTRIRRKFDQSKDMLKISQFLTSKSDYDEFDEDEWLVYIRSLSKHHRRNFYDFWRTNNEKDKSDEKYQAIQSSFADEIRYVYEKWVAQYTEKDKSDEKYQEDENTHLLYCDGCLKSIHKQKSIDRNRSD